ncbi:MAG: hypothetical protein Q8Q89_03830 [bacterium]|nr:hypothetical protein [bacterium]
MSTKKAYLIEPGERSFPVKGSRGWKVRSRKVAEIARLIHEKYPKVVIAKPTFFPDTEIINTLVIQLPKTLTREMIEKEFSCGLIEVAYEPRSS